MVNPQRKDGQNCVHDMIYQFKKKKKKKAIRKKAFCGALLHQPLQKRKT